MMRATFKRSPTPAETAQALAQVERLCRPTERELAEARLRKAKAMMSTAAEAVMATHPEAADLGDRALVELKAAQANLARINAEASDA